MSALKSACKRKISRRLRKNLHITILSLFGGEIIFETFQPMWSQYLNVTDGQMDKQTDGQTKCNLITVLCVASRGKKRKNYARIVMVVMYVLLTAIETWPTNQPEVDDVIFSSASRVCIEYDIAVPAVHLTDVFTL